VSVDLDIDCVETAASSNPDRESAQRVVAESGGMAERIGDAVRIAIRVRASI
jgi:hypothetical protein